MPSVSIDIDAPPPTVWALVSDLPRMGEWSPECYRCDWVEGATEAVAGARFKGRNRRGVFRWSTNGEVVTATAPEELAFDISYLGMKVARWRYVIEPSADGGSRVTESTDDVRGPVMKVLGTLGTGVTDREAHNLDGMRETLAKIKAAAEAAQPK